MTRLLRFAAVALVCALFGLMGPMVKPDSIVALRAETEASQTLYTSRATVTNECLIFEPQAPEGVKAMAKSQVDSAVPRITHCEITVDWSRYSIRAVPTRDGESNLGDLESRVTNKTVLTYTVPYGTRVDLFLYEPDRQARNIEKSWLSLPASSAVANRRY